MIARFDYRPMLTALLALSTSVLVVVVITLSALLITSPEAASPASTSSGSNPAAPAPRGRTPDRMAKFTDTTFTVHRGRATHSGLHIR